MAGGFGKLTPDQVNAALAAQGASYRVPAPAQVASVPPGASPVGAEGELAFPDAPDESAQPMGPPVDQDLAFPNAPVVEAASGTDLVPPGSLGSQLYQNNKSAYQLQEPAVAPAVAVSGGPGALARQPAAVPSVNPFALRPPQMGAPRAPGMPASPFAGMAKEAGARAATEQEAAKQAEIAYDIGAATQAQGIEDQAAAQEAGAADQEALFKRAAAKDQDYAARAQLAQTAWEQTTAKRLAEKEAEAKQMEYYEVGDKRSTGTKAMAAIAIGLGELGAGISRAFGVGGQQNTALSIINQDVDRRLQEQQIRLDNAKTAATMRDSAYGLAMAAYKDKRDVDSYARELENNATIKEIEAAKAKLTGKEALAQADSLIGQLAQQNAQLSLQRHDRRFEQAFGEQQAFSIKDYEAKARAAAAAAKAQEQQPLAFIGKNVQIKDPQAFAAYSAQAKPAELEKLRTATQGHAQYVGALKELRKLKEQYGSEGRLTPWTTEEEAKMEALQQQAVSGANDMKDGSVLNEGEYQRYVQSIPGAKDMASNAVPKIDGLIYAADNRLNSRLETIGAGMYDPDKLVKKGAAK